MPGVLLVGERSGCLGSVFVPLRSWRRFRPVLLRGESCGRSFLVTCGRASMNDQSKYTNGVNGLLTLVFGHRALPPNFLDVLLCLTWGHIDWKQYILPLRLMDRAEWKECRFGRMSRVSSLHIWSVFYYFWWMSPLLQLCNTEPDSADKSRMSEAEYRVISYQHRLQRWINGPMPRGETADETFGSRANWLLYFRSRRTGPRILFSK